MLKRSKEIGSQSELTSAVLEIVQVPLEMAQCAVDILEIIFRTAAICHPAVLADLGSAVALAQSALNGAGINVRENVKRLGEDSQLAQSLISRVMDFENRFIQLGNQVKSILQERGNLNLPGTL